MMAFYLVLFYSMEKNLSKPVPTFKHETSLLLNNMSYCFTHFLLCAGLPRAHPESYHSYMWNNFFKHIDIDPANAHILDGNAADLEAECKAFEQKISEAGGLELFVGGNGPCICLHHLPESSPFVFGF